MKPGIARSWSWAMTAFMIPGAGLLDGIKFQYVFESGKTQGLRKGLTQVFSLLRPPSTHAHDGSILQLRTRHHSQKVSTATKQGFS